MWLSVIKPSMEARFFGCNLKDWCCINLRNQNGDGHGPWREVFVVICWLLWKRRNERVFENNLTHTHELISKARAIVSSFNKAKVQLQRVNISGAAVHEERNTKRIDNDTITVQVDGAFSQRTGKASCGGTIRNTDHQIQEAFMFSMINGDPLVAELWACLIGLKRAWDRGHRKVLLLSDSLEVVRLINDGAPELHEN
ncbi:uncharacterized protein LOC114741426 [Neltuma alba]|uniref:uncharacterized protein LOC114741426 n=1 Tax=Neltuma alba TaxID=207710 RepID=UPI0010A3F69F|nr:uncharacterized protein LOC114741426 [Prosopis alba]